MLRPHAGVVQPGGHGVAVQHLPVVVLQQVAEGAVQHPRPPRLQAQAVPPGVQSAAGGLHPHQPHPGVVHEVRENADGVGAATDAGDDGVRQPPGRPQDLGPGLPADDALELAHQERVRVWPGGGAENVVGVGEGGGPVAQRLVDRILEGAGPALHRHHLGAQQAHAEDVGLLALHVAPAHVDAGAQAEEGPGHGRGHAVLPGPGLGDEAGLAGPPGQQGLGQDLVGLVGAAVHQVLALQEEARPGAPRQAAALVDRGGAAGVVRQQGAQLGLERGV